MVEDSNMNQLQKIIANGYKVIIKNENNSFVIEGFREGYLPTFAEDADFETALSKFNQQFVF